jgi:Mrp family chromosome partitioning ATPase
LITSTQPGEGKTTVATNLALSLILAGKRALLIDADLRRPTLDSVFRDSASSSDDGRNTKRRPGIAAVREGGWRVGEVVQRLHIDVAGAAEGLRLSVIPAGRVSALRFALLESPQLDETLRFCRDNNDVVLLDSPPVLAVSDALLIAPKVDGVILIVNAGTVTEREAKRAKDSLEKAGGRVVGVVINRFDDGAGPAYHPYAGYYGEPD